MTQVRWPLALEFHEAEVSGDDNDYWGADALAVEATEYVAAEARVEPFWRALIVMAAVPFIAGGVVLLFSLMEH